MKSLQYSKNPSTTSTSSFFQKGSSEPFFGKADKPFFSAPSIQTKLTVNQPGDSFEKEADTMADKVVRNLNNPVQSNSEVNVKPIFNHSPIPVQRKCAACEKEEKLQKKEPDEKDLLKDKVQRKSIFESNEDPPNDTNPIQRKCASCDKEEKIQKKHDLSGLSMPSSTLESNLNASKGGGSPMPASIKNQMESSFGTDFSNVRLHTDNSSVQMNRGLKAHAFTHGSDIYFNSGKYDTNTFNGKSLLAHELTHVIQQGHSTTLPTVQRLKDSDFKISGLDPDQATDNTVIRFEGGSSVIPAVELPKITTQAKPPLRDITLNGYSSEEGTVPVNTALVNTRINNVSKKLRSKGHSGPQRPNPNPTGRDGNSNYRGTRIVEIVNTPVGIGAVVPTKVKTCASISTPCNTSFSTASPLAITKVTKAIIALAAPNAATLSQVTTFFGATAPATILAHLGSLLGQITALIGLHNGATDCHLNDCDGTCGQGASAYIDPSVAPAKMIFCDGFTNDPSNNSRADTFIHESLHATPGVLTKDIAYAHTRRIRTLSDAEKLKNTDNYVNLISILHDPLAAITVPPTDSINGPVTAPESAFAQNAIDFMEQWLIAAKFNTGDLYSAINSALTTPATWQTPAMQSFHYDMEKLSPLFGLTNPGAGPPAAAFNLPSKSDRTRVAGIADRFNRMRNVLYGQTITLTKITSGAETWSPPTLTVIGNSVKVKPAFFAKTTTEAIKHLLRLMVKSMRDTPSSMANSYAEAVDRIRTLNSVGP